MTTTQPTLVPPVLAPDFDSFAVRQAIAGLLAGYGDTTRDADTLDLRGSGVRQPRAAGVCGEAGPYRVVCPESRTNRQGSSHGGAAAVDDCRVLPVLRRRTVVPGVAGGASAAPEVEL
jgi:hypothetical protein